MKKKPSKYHKVALYLATILPILFILTLAGYIYLPSYSDQGPDYRFVYTRTGLSYQFDDDRLESRRGTDESTPLYIYDPASGMSEEITFEEAQQLSYHRLKRNVSPDGYTVVEGQTDRYFPFGRTERDDTRFYIQKDNIRKRVNLDYIDTSSKQRAFFFIAWINE